MKKKEKEKNYREALNEIENIIKHLENNTDDIDNMLDNVKKATELIQFCKNKLHSIVQEVNNIITP